MATKKVKTNEQPVEEIKTDRNAENMVKAAAEHAAAIEAYNACVCQAKNPV